MEVVFKIIGVLGWTAIIAFPLALVGLLIFFVLKIVFFKCANGEKQKDLSKNCKGC
ncbi:MAG: hypothetical protein IJ437_06435 [Clostridia bacterium]|nr:hypothetical protein [Clostridia bacterium]